MYRSCIFCSADLGSNESIEQFPVGRALAFDAAKGRLWAVCPRCARWNLAPLEERWEAIESGERLFRDTRLRAQSENVGLAKLRDGTRLIRVGQALPGELAAVRYGRAYQRRHLVRTATAVGAGTAGAVGVLAVSPAIVTVLVVAAPVAVVAHRALRWLTAAELVAPEDVIHAAGSAVRKVRSVVGKTHYAALRLQRESIPTGVPGERVVLNRVQLRGARLVPTESGGFGVHLPAIDLRLEGWQAQALAARRLVHLNRKGGDAQDLAAAVRMISGPHGAAGYVDYAAGKAMPIGPDAAHHGVQALALEMALHEETERRAMEGELAILEQMWREAEEIAALADRLPGLPAPRPPRV